MISEVIVKLGENVELESRLTHLYLCIDSLLTKSASRRIIIMDKKNPNYNQLVLAFFNSFTLTFTIELFISVYSLKMTTAIIF